MGTIEGRMATQQMQMVAFIAMMAVMTMAMPMCQSFTPSIPTSVTSTMVGSQASHQRQQQQSLGLTLPSLLVASRSSITSQIRPFTASPTSLGMYSGNGSSNGGDDDQLEQALGAVRSLTDFHQGKWKGTCRSFTVTSDVAAGVVQRSKCDYEVKVRVQPTQGDFQLTEQFQVGTDEVPFVRAISMKNCQVDVDDVDGSYSLDHRQSAVGADDDDDDDDAPVTPLLPTNLILTDKQQSVVVEHNLAVSDDRRSRLWAVYGEDDTLIRVVVAQEDRLPEDEDEDGRNVLAQQPMGGMMDLQKELLELDSDVDRLVDKLTGSTTSKQPNIEVKSVPGGTPATPQIVPPNPMDQLQSAMSGRKDDAVALSLHPTNLLEISSGVWLGDLIIRDYPSILMIPNESSRGFGATPAAEASTEPSNFGDWSIGVQKIAWRWMWNFGDEIRQITDVGKAMGSSYIAALSKPLAGTVSINEGLSRRMKIDDRMVHVTWSGDNVGFIVGSTAVQIPRYFAFDARSAAQKPIYTDFSVFQSGDIDSSGEPMLDENGDPLPNLPTVVCSKNTRVYNYEGRLKQGCSSFYTFKRFGIDDDEI